nr:hypothetical protein 15 [Desulfobulbaceae bacterium]
MNKILNAVLIGFVAIGAVACGGGEPSVDSQLAEIPELVSSAFIDSAIEDIERQTREIEQITKDIERISVEPLL